MVAKTYFWDPVEDNVVQTVTSGGLTNYNSEPTLFGQVISVEVDGSSRCLHSDTLGSVISATDSGQNAIGNWAYSAFGESTESTAIKVAALGYCGRFGYFSDSGGKSIYVRRRTYDFTYIRWFSRDLSEKDVLHPYVYVSSRPVLLIDPEGLEDRKITVKCDFGDLEVNCPKPDPPSGGKPVDVKPCSEAEIKASTVTTCATLLSAAQEDPAIRSLISDLNSRMCKLPTISCGKCEGSCKGAGAWHFSDTSGSRAIYMCDDQPWNAANMLEKLSHELTHALQTCRKDPDKTCIDRLRKELEASLSEKKKCKDAIASAVWSACYTLRCKIEEITPTVLSDLYNKNCPEGTKGDVAPM